MGRSPVQNIGSTPRARKSYYPFLYGMRTSKDQGKGEMLAQNLRIEDGRYVKMRGNTELLEVEQEVLGSKSIQEVLYVWEFQQLPGQYQMLFVYEDPKAITGTVTFTQGSANVSGVGTTFIADVRLGSFIFAETDGSGSAYEVLSVTDDFNLVLKEVYTGNAVAGNALYRRFLLRATKEGDDTVIIPVNDIEYLSPVFDYVQIGVHGYLSNKVTLANKHLTRWDGTTLHDVTFSGGNTIEYPNFVSNLGQRLVAGNETGTFASQENVPISQFDGGTFTAQNMDFNVNMPGIQTAAEPAAGGCVVFFEHGAEMHDANPSNSGTGLSGMTLRQGFGYTGVGVKSPRQVTSGNNMIYFVNDEGLFEMDPYRGSAKNLVDQDSGALGHFWNQYTFSDSQIVYSEKEEMLLVPVRKKDEGIHDTILCIDVRKKERPAYLKKDVYVQCLGRVGRQVYGGSANDGKLMKVFDEDTYANGYGGPTKCRLLLEWDPMSNPIMEKQSKKFVIHSVLHPDDEMTARLYLNHDFDPVAYQKYGVNSLPTSGTVYGMLGQYVFGIGVPDERELAEKIKKRNKSRRFSVYTIEIESEGLNNFEVQDILFEYLKRGTPFKNISMPWRFRY